MDRALFGEISDLNAEINNEIDAWHEYEPAIGDKIGETLHSWLGMRWDEYATWVANPKSLPLIIKGRLS